MLRDEVKVALTEAMKSGDTQRVATLRLVMAALKDRDIAARSKGNTDGIDDDEFLGMLGTMIKQRQESARLYKEGGRDDLVKAEEAEIATIRSFMPEQMDDDAIRDAIRKAMQSTGADSVKDMGKVMAYLKENFAGQMDFGSASSMVKEMLLKDSA